MRPRFRPYSVILVFLCIGFSCTHLLADNKSKAKDTAKASSQKAVAKNDAKNASKKSDKPDSVVRKEKAKDTQLAKAKSTDKKATSKKEKEKLSEKNATAKREDKSRGKEKEKTAKREIEKKIDNKLVKSTDKKKAEDTKKKAVSAKGEVKKKEEVAVKKAAPVKENPASVSAKTQSKPDTKSVAKGKSDKNVKLGNEDETLLAKTISQATTRTPAQGETASTKREESIKQLPATKFTFRPVTKITPKVELKFTLAKALAPSYDPPPPVEPSGPDVIEVIEYDSPENKKLDEMYRQEVKALSLSNIPNVSNRKIDIKKMDADRISQIQEALQKRGYYMGAITGVYDDGTVEAMRQFQSAHKIDVTGYATAHTLKLLGLTDWERHYE